MIELYCELLLARATVLDQLAFTDKGAEARHKAKEELNQLNLEKKNASSSSSSASSKPKATEVKKSGSGFGWFSSSKPATTTVPEIQKDQPPPANTVPDGTDESNEEANSYINAGLDEAAVAIFYACPRFPREVKELTTLRLLLMDRWGKEFATLAQDNKTAIKIPERLVKKLRVKPPSKELVESYLREIAKAYNVAWPAEEEIADSHVPEPMSSEDTPPAYGDDADDGDVAGDAGLSPRTPRKSHAEDVRRASETDELTRATPPRDIGPHDAKGKSPISVVKPGPSSDNPEPRVKIPGDTEGNKNDSRPGGGLQRKDSKGIPNVDELSKRFAALKR